CEWSRPVSAEEDAAAPRGDWAVKQTPGALPAHWLGDVRGREFLCLASAGGAQAPLLSAPGARVTRLYSSAGQRDNDR
ncbi:SAM-dependent methyltransferase, partial [Pseudomonas aeruginosa]